MPPEQSTTRQGTLRDAMQYASQNPKSDFAIQLKSYLASGQADKQAQELGIDLAPFKRTALPIESGTETEIPEITPEVPDARLSKVAKGFDVVFGGGKLGSAIGGSIVAGGELLKGNIEGARNIARSQPTAKEVGGDIIRMISLPVSLAFGQGFYTVAMKVSSALGLPALAGKVVAGGISGYAFDLAENLRKNKDTLEAIKPGLATAVGAALPVVAEGFKAFGRLLGITGNKIQTTIIKPSAADLKDGFSINTIRKYNLGGSLKNSFEKTDTLMDDLSRQLNNKLKASTETVNLEEVYKKTAERVLGEKAQSFGANTAMERALGGLQEEIGVVAEQGRVSVPSANLIKRSSGHLGAWLYGVPDADANAKQRVYNVFYNEIKKAIENASPEGVKGINKQLSELIPVMNALIKRIPVAERNAALSLTDIITLTGATLEPKALSLALLNFASKSGTVGTWIYNLGQLIQSTGPVKEAIGHAASIATKAFTSQRDLTEPIPEIGL